MITTAKGSIGTSTKCPTEDYRIIEIRGAIVKTRTNENVNAVSIKILIGATWLRTTIKGTKLENDGVKAGND